MAEDKKPVVIGLDFGNFNSYVSYIQDLDFAAGRLGGKAQELMPTGEFRDGIPSVFYYKAGDARPLLCLEALNARPLANQVRYLKRGLFKPLMIDGQQVRINGKGWLYDDAIREVVQEVLRRANKELYDNFRKTTNLVSLAYPVTYSPVQVERLIKIVESATVELRDDEGAVHRKKVKVFGTIPEAPAAALDYLAEHESYREKSEVTAATFDLGGGTFDAAVVRCYPKGRTRPDGSTYYYDLLWQGGLRDLGGKEFTEIVAELAEKKLQKRGVKLNDRQRERLQQVRAEKAKRDLTDAEAAEFEVIDDEYVKITREEFEKATAAQVQRMVDVLGQAMHSSEFKPDMVLLSGGASRMPMIKKALEKAFPAWKGRIEAYRPEQAISFGAARYGAAENPAVQKRTAFDLGTDVLHSGHNSRSFSCIIDAGTPIPHQSNWVTYSTVVDNSTHVGMNIFEATVSSPNENDLSGNYRKIINCRLSFDQPVPANTPVQGRLVIDKLGVLFVEAREREGARIVREKGEPTLKG